DLRVLVRERLQAGESDQQVIDFLVARYGEFVLLRPRVLWHTALLWFGPATILIIGAFGVLVFARRYRATTAAGQATLTAGDAGRSGPVIGHFARRATMSRLR